MKFAAYLVAASALFMSHAALAHDYHAGDIHIVHPWSRATPPAAQVGGGFLKLENKGEAADRLVSASSPVAGRVEIHSMEVTDGVMRMRPLADGLEIKPGATVELAPGGYHLMLMELKQPLKEGERVPLTLTFEKAGSIDVELAVEAARPSGNHGAHGGHEAQPQDHGHKH